ncbi:hypothetical protein SETIT_9G271800v2 [Setaria italica]|uniref:Uncharacterized protein n=1 Tax=Setaria italica TaxID=4555 RepID=A0A368SLA6_SETIT|nr:hypothetical protein SETIT_9G271800v2 [Setaria italica]
MQALVRGEKSFMQMLCSLFPSTSCLWLSMHDSMSPWQMAMVAVAASLSTWRGMCCQTGRPPQQCQLPGADGDFAASCWRGVFPLRHAKYLLPRNCSELAFACVADTACRSGLASFPSLPLF